MNIYAPDYFPHFKCTATECKHNCCIGWEIDIDDDTLEFYNSVKSDFGRRLKDSIFSENGISYFKLTKNERCAFLNSDNLCDIILNLGEEHLCQICTDHPRFRNYFDNHTEIGIGLTCEEASRLILSNQNKVKIINLETGKELKTPETPNDVLTLRNNIIDILQNRDLLIEQRINNLVSEYKLIFPKKTLSEWADFYISLEQLDSNWSNTMKTLKNISGYSCDIFNDSVWQTAFEQLIVYFIYRHFSDFVFDDSFNERICFSILSYRIIYGLCLAYQKANSVVSTETLFEFARQYSSEIEYSEENINALFSELTN